MVLTSLQVCMDSSDWLQGTLHEESGMDSSSPSGDMITCSRPLMERRLRPQHDQPLKCPRCDSAHTKFCYYNNYSLSQPRYFCKTCRRYWTKGGTLRNIPVGGGCRKNKKVANNNKKSPNDQQSLINVQNCGSTSSNSHNSTDLHLSLPPEIQLSQLNCLMNGHGVFSSNNGFSDTAKFNVGMLENSTRPIDFIMESKLEAIVGNSRNYDFMGMNGDHHQFGTLGGGGVGIGDMSNNGFAQNFHGVCSPFGVSSIDGNNGAFVDTCQRLMLPYYDHHHAQHEEDHNVIDVKPNPKLLSLEWQDQSCSDAGKNNSYGYYNSGIGSSWNGMMNDYNSSATNPLV